MFKLIKRRCAYKRLKNIMPQLALLKRRLFSSKECKDPVFEIVNYFDYICKIKDGNLVKETLEIYQETDDEKAKHLLSLFQKLIESSGRNKGGLNRANEYEEITLDNIYLEDASGKWILPVRFWIKAASKEEYEFLQKQAKAFMEPRIDHMLYIISELESIAV